MAELQNGFLLTASYDSSIKIWYPDTGLQISSISTIKNERTVKAFNNGDFATGSYNNNLEIWDAITGTLKYTLRNHTARINSISQLLNGDIATCSSDSIWDWNTMNLKTTLTGHSSAIFALYLLDNGYLVSGSNDRSIIIWQ